MPTRSQLKQQFDRARKLGWLPFVEKAGSPYGFSTALLLAIGSRETNLDPKYLKISGDAGNGYGPWQIDKRSYPEFVASGDWKDPEKAVKKAAEVLDEKRNEVTDLAVKDDFSPDALLRLAIAAYNCGSGPAYHNYMKHTNPDRGTTGGDYSLDVLERTGVFEELLAKEETAPATGSVVTTVSTKVESSDPPKTQPPPQEITPANSVTVTTSQPSLKSKLVAFAHWIVAGLTGIGIGIDAIWNKVLGFAGNHTVFLVLIIFIGVLVIVGAWVYDRSMQRAQERTLKAADLAGAQDKNNIYFQGPK